MATYRDIPEGSIEIQTGLWLYSYDIVVSGVTHTMRKLYASEGYCFYDTALDTYDEEGNLNPRTYYQFMSLGINKDIITIVSIPCTEDHEIV